MSYELSAVTNEFFNQFFSISTITTLRAKKFASGKPANISANVFGIVSIPPWTLEKPSDAYDNQREPEIYYSDADQRVALEFTMYFIGLFLMTIRCI